MVVWGNSGTVNRGGGNGSGGSGSSGTGGGGLLLDFGICLPPQALSKGVAHASVSFVVCLAMLVCRAFSC